MAYWIQVEMKAEGDITSAIQMDLEKVTRVSIARQNGKVAKYLIGYEGCQILIEGEKGVQDFKREWDEFQPMLFASKENEPGLIATASASLPAGMNGKSILRG